MGFLPLQPTLTCYGMTMPPILLLTDCLCMEGQDQATSWHISGLDEGFWSQGINHYPQ